jgi:ferric iron reductase protein FhuF
MERGETLTMTTAISSMLNPKELDYLEVNFRYAAVHSEDMIDAVKLLDEKLLLSNLNTLKSQISASSLVTAASQFSKRYAFLLTTVGLYTMTMWNKGLNLSLEHTLLTLPKKDNGDFPKVTVDDSSLFLADEAHRKAWRDVLIKTIFSGNLSKVWKSLHAVSKVPMPILWENTAVYIFWLYETKMREEGTNQEVSQRIKEDLHYLVTEAAGELFGEKENPLTKYYTKNCTKFCNEEPMRMRKTCCLYYQLTDKENAVYCKTCPKQK